MCGRRAAGSRRPRTASGALCERRGTRRERPRERTARPLLVRHLSVGRLSLTRPPTAARGRKTQCGARKGARSPAPSAPLHLSSRLVLFDVRLDAQQHKADREALGGWEEGSRVGSRAGRDERSRRLRHPALQTPSQRTTSVMAPMTAATEEISDPMLAICAISVAAAAAAAGAARAGAGPRLAETRAGLGRERGRRRGVGSGPSRPTPRAAVRRCASAPDRADAATRATSAVYRRPNAGRAGHAGRSTAPVARVEPGSHNPAPDSTRAAAPELPAHRVGGYPNSPWGEAAAGAEAASPHARPLSTHRWARAARTPARGRTVTDVDTRAKAMVGAVGWGRCGAARAAAGAALSAGTRRRPPAPPGGPAPARSATVMPRWVVDDDDEAPACPLCAEPLDAEELVLRLCADCDFKLCLFCYKRLGEAAAVEGGGSAKCPNCRARYDADRVARATVDPVRCVASGGGAGATARPAAARRCPVRRRRRSGPARRGGAAPRPACGPVWIDALRTGRGAGGRRGPSPGDGRPPTTLQPRRSPPRAGCRRRAASGGRRGARAQRSGGRRMGLGGLGRLGFAGAGDRPSSLSSLSCRTWPSCSAASWSSPGSPRPP